MRSALFVSILRMYSFGQILFLRFVVSASRSKTIERDWEGGKHEALDKSRAVALPVCTTSIFVFCSYEIVFVFDFNRRHYCD